MNFLTMDYYMETACRRKQPADGALPPRPGHCDFVEMAVETFAG